MELADLLQHPRSLAEMTPAGWETILSAASADLVLPTLHVHLENQRLSGDVPADVRNVLAASATFNSERNEYFLAEAVYAARLLNSIGILPIALKGVAYLIAGVYPNPSSRYLLDIDFLVAANELRRAADVLKAYGYLENEGGKLLRFRHHYPSLQRDNKPSIEVHHRLGQGICARLLTEAEISSASRPVTLAGATFLIPSPTHLVTHLILHSQLAHPYYDRIFPSLRALVDLVHLQDRYSTQIDWNAVELSFSKAGEASTLKLHVRHAQRVLGFEIAPDQNLPAFRKLTGIEKLRWYRRILLNCHPSLRYIEPVYVLMSLFSRRLRIIPDILTEPGSWPEVIRLLTQSDFYANMFKV